MTTAESMPWSGGAWTAPPVTVVEEGPDLLVTAAEGSDAWRHTAYGFVHDGSHALLAPLGCPGTVEVSFDASFGEQFDSAGLMVRADAERWVKARVEVSDGVLQVGPVVTLGRSDWSVAPVPEWAGRRVSVRASRAPPRATRGAVVGVVGGGSGRLPHRDVLSHLCSHRNPRAMVQSAARVVRSRRSCMTVPVAGSIVARHPTTGPEEAVRRTLVHVHRST